MTRLESRKLRCPCCKRRFKTSVLLSWNTLGPVSTDLRGRAVGTEPLPFAIHTCPSCGYSGDECDFGWERVDSRLKAFIRERLTPLAIDLEAFPGRRFEFAAWIAEWRGDPHLYVGLCFLRAAWCWADNKKETEEKYCRRMAIEYFECALVLDEVTENDVAVVNYLVAENYRRIGKEKKALAWYNSAIEAAGDDGEKKWLIRLARRQKAEPSDDYPHRYRSQRDKGIKVIDLAGYRRHKD
ncbi:MAG: DUF2225 domain-containing protein [Thermodesulfobacteriota bacterium]|nr:DUF2225 domain-containing protein [Thermodesulfobacteriota bacterium]